MPDAWRGLDDELALWQAAGRPARLWLRDDDAVEPTAALDRLIAVTRRHRIPVLLAVIPAGATMALADRMADEPHVLPCQHGFAHRNHAPAGEKAAELGPHRPVALVAADIRAGRARLLDLLGERLHPVLVPPWNRIAPAVLPELPGLGLRALSTFGRPQAAAVPGLREANCHVDVIDWKGTRGGRDHAKLLGDLTEALAAAREQGGAPVGILTHHLVHDDGAWAFLESLFSRTAGHAAAHWVSFDAACPFPSGERAGGEAG